MLPNVLQPIQPLIWTLPVYVFDEANHNRLRLMMAQLQRDPHVDRIELQEDDTPRRCLTVGFIPGVGGPQKRALRYLDAFLKEMNTDLPEELKVGGPTPICAPVPRPPMSRYERLLLTSPDDYDFDGV